ncbi:MAG TPA: GGDEF domain-containing protein, partial [Thermomicrobiales bacterium]|nr:GGDEF domain-containing protein [Thermomicrobiales bacterium]
DDFYYLSQCRYDEGRARILAGDRDGAIVAFRQSLNAWSHMVTPELPSAIVLARSSLESLTGQWTRATIDDLLTVLGRAKTEYKAVTLAVYAALAEAMEHFGDLAAANTYLRENAKLQEAYWREVATARSHHAAKALQTIEAQRTAESERRQRRAIDEAMQRVVILNAQNERLVTQLQEQSVVLEQMAREDSLTNLANRRYFDEQLQRELVRSESFQRPFSLAMVDIDDFKAINDRYTHIVGDEVLRTVARLMRMSSRVTDFVARYGGEEFAVIFTEADHDEADALTEKIRSSIERHSWDRLAEGLSVTISIGLVTVSGNIGATAVVARADEMLYAAKRRGKNLTASGWL